MLQTITALRSLSQFDKYLIVCWSKLGYRSHGVTVRRSCIYFILNGSLYGSWLLWWHDMIIKVSHFMITWLLVKKLLKANNKEIIKALHYWPFVLWVDFLVYNDMEYFAAICIGGPYLSGIFSLIKDLVTYLFYIFLHLYFTLLSLSNKILSNFKFPS